MQEESKWLSETKGKQYDRKLVERLLNEDQKDDAENYVKSFADEGNLDACFDYGMACYKKSYGRPSNNTAYEYLKKSIAQNHPDYLYGLAIFMLSAYQDAENDNEDEYDIHHLEYSDFDTMMKALEESTEEPVQPMVISADKLISQVRSMGERRFSRSEAEKYLQKAAELGHEKAKKTYQWVLSDKEDLLNTTGFDILKKNLKELLK